MRNIIVIIIVAIFALGYFVSKHQEKQPKKAFEVYMNEPLNVTGLDITVTDVKETKKIHKYTAKNMFVQVFLTIKNTKSTENYVPMLALIHRQDDNWTCLPDRRFALDDKLNDFTDTGFVVKPNAEIKAYVPFTCDNYLNEKAGPRKSKPADFKMMAYNKLKKDGGYIFLEKRP